MTRRSWIWVAVIAVLGFAAYKLIGDVGALRASLRTFHWWAFGTALGLALLNYAIRFARWQLYLRWRDVRVPVGSSAIVFGAGLSLSLTPAKLGELIKSYLLRELHGVPAVQTAPIVVAERVSDLIALLGLSIIGVAAYGIDPTLVIAAAALMAAGLVLLAWPRPTRALIELATRPQLTARFRTPLLEMYGGLAALCRPVQLTLATAIALPAWACECIGFALIVDAFPGAHVAMPLAIAIYAATTIAGALSFLPGGLGVTESGMALLLMNAADVVKPTAVAATLLTRFATLWFAVALGLGFLSIARRRIGRMPPT